MDYLIAIDRFRLKLASFKSPELLTGKRIMSKGGVTRLTVSSSATSVTARVHHTDIHSVTFNFQTDQGWQFQCDCGFKDHYCSHTSALFLAIDFRIRSDVIQPAPEHAPPSIEQQILEDLFRDLKRAKPTREEKKLLDQVTALYLRLARQHLFPTGGDLVELGMKGRVSAWDRIQLWEEFPANDHEFWLYIVQFARRNFINLPDFMNSVSKTRAIGTQLERLENNRLAQRWMHIFEKHRQLAFTPQETVMEASPPPSILMDLRLRFYSFRSELEFKENSQPIWHPLDNDSVRNLKTQIQDGQQRLSVQGESLMNRMHIAGIGLCSVLEYDRKETALVLRGILLNQHLHNLCVNEIGKPFEYSKLRLSWKMTQLDQDSSEGYEIQLSDEKETTIRDFKLTIQSSPGLYLQENRWYEGPSQLNDYLKPLDRNFVPKKLAESDSGVSFFTRLGVKLPEKMVQRLHYSGLHPLLKCSITSSRSDECRIEVFGVDPKGKLIQVWLQDRWGFLKPENHESNDESSPEDSSQPIAIYTAEKLACIPASVELLKIRSRVDYITQGSTETLTPYYYKKITRKFPEDFHGWLEGLPQEVEVQLEGELACFDKSCISNSVSLQVTETDIDWFDLKLVVNVEDTQLTKKQIQLLVEANGKWVRFEKQGWRRLEFNLSEEESKQLASLGVSPQHMSGESEKFHALQLAHPTARKFLPEDQAKSIQLRANAIQTRIQPSVPKSIKAELRPYQIEGFHFLAYLTTNHFGGILADDMGLGKTLQTLTWLVWLRQDKEHKKLPSLVVCPKSVMDNWQTEVKRFTPGIKVKVWSPSELKTFQKQVKKFHLHVINYSQLRILGENLADTPFLAVIMDEGQNIKNPSSQTAQIARSLTARYRLVLTGTPIENRLMDLWSLMAFAMPGVLSSRNQFGKLYNAKDDPFARLRLSSRVRPFVIRRTKTQVARDLPDRIEEDLQCEMEGEQLALYLAEQKRAQQILLRIKTQKELNEFRFNILTSLLRLRQICCHPKLINANSKAESAKTDVLIEQLEPIMQEGNKVLIFSQFVGLLSILDTQMKKKKWKTWTLTGSTENRGNLVDSFQNHEGPGIFLISLKAGGSGLNLTAASYVVLFDPWWNPAVENQAIDRTHRIGQVNKVIAYRLIIKNSIEEKIRELQKTKKSMAEDVLGEEKFSESLSISDFEYLFS